MVKQHTKEFKKETVRLIIQTGRSVKDAAGELGLNYWTLKGWMKAYGKQEQADLVSKGLKMTPEEENRLLRKELADVAEERDILKKAIAVFSKKPKLNTLS
jgi:transposase